MRIKELIKKHWKTIVIIILVLALIWFVALPRYNQTIAQIGYNQALNDLGNSKQIPLFISRDNQTQIITVGICSPEFQQNYQEICPQ